MKDSFNTDFYVTAATVIPVLYLALAVQGSTFGAMLTWLSQIVPGARKGWIVLKLTEGRLAWFRNIPGGIWFASTIIAVFAFGTVLVLALSLAANLVGEVFALWALYYGRQSSPWQGQFVLWSLISLAVMIALVTFVRAFPTFIEVLTLQRRRRRALRGMLEALKSPDFRSELDAMDPAERAKLITEMAEALPVLDRMIEEQRRFNAAAGYVIPREQEK